MSDPGIFPDANVVGSVDQQHETIDRDWHLNGPVSISRKKRKRSAADRRERRGLDGGSMSPRQKTAIKALRHYEDARANDELPDLPRCMGGSALLRIFAAGGAYRYSFARPPQLCSQRRRGDSNEKLTPDDWLALELVLAVQLMHDAQALMARYDDLVPIIGQCYDTVGVIMRKLVRLGWLAFLPMHKRSGCGHYQRRSNVYWVTDRALERLGIERRPKMPAPPSPGQREASAMVRSLIAAAEAREQTKQALNADHPQLAIDQADQAFSMVSPSNPDPSEFPSPRDVSGLPGDHKREARGLASLGFGARSAREPFFSPLVALPDESHLRPEAADRVKTRPAAPSGSGGEESASVDDPDALERYRNPQNFAKLVAREVAKVRRADQQSDERARETIRLAYRAEIERLRSKNAAAMVELVTVVKPPAAPASGDPIVVYLAALEQSGNATAQELRLLARLRARDARDAQMDEGAAAGVGDDELTGLVDDEPTDEIGGDS